MWCHAIYMQRKWRDFLLFCFVCVFVFGILLYLHAGCCKAYFLEGGKNEQCKVHFL